MPMIFKTGLLSVLLGLAFFFASNLAWRVVFPDPQSNAFACVCCLLSAALSSPRNRGRAHQFLGSLGRRDAELEKEQAAATIAALVGGSDAVSALREGIKRFRAIDTASIEEADFASSKDTGMYARTTAAELGTVAAFVSHSWSDDGAAKYAQLQKWASEGEAGARTLVWLDKACIDQAEIAANLSALPVFLSGCQKLLVLAGPTYTSRLWCVVELFTFCKMGGRLEHIRVCELSGDLHSALAHALNHKAALCMKNPGVSARLRSHPKGVLQVDS